MVATARKKSKKKKRPPTRTRLIEAAMELFHARGYHETSLAAIGEKAKVNAGSLYYFFKTKEQLLLAVLDRYVELLDPAIVRPAFARTEDPIERVFAILEGYRQMLLQTECNTGCPIGNLALELTDAGKEVRERITLNFANWCRAIENCLEAAGDALPQDLDRRQLSRFVLTIMEGGILQARGQRSVRPYEDAVAQLRDYFNRLQSAGKKLGDS